MNVSLSPNVERGNPYSRFTSLSIIGWCLVNMNAPDLNIWVLQTDLRIQNDDLSKAHILNAQETTSLNIFSQMVSLEICQMLRALEAQMQTVDFSETWLTGRAYLIIFSIQ
jgi:hypothetical protein